MATPASDFLMKKTLYYRKLYFTTEKFTLLQKMLLHKKYFFLQNLCQLKFLLPFKNQLFLFCY